jgi:hypothetical protein
MEEVDPPDVRSHLAEMLQVLWPAYEAGKLGDAQDTYDKLAGDLGLVRLVMGEWREAVDDALPLSEPVGDAVERGKRDILKRAATYMENQKHAAGLNAINSSEDTVKAAEYRGRQLAYTDVITYLLGAAGELPWKTSSTSCCHRCCFFWQWLASSPGWCG